MGYQLITTPPKLIKKCEHSENYNVLKETRRYCLSSLRMRNKSHVQVKAVGEYLLNEYSEQENLIYSSW